jgi:HEAT repeat protein
MVQTAASSKIIKENVCPACGGKTVAKAKFCTHCGQKLSASPLVFPKIAETLAERRIKEDILTELKLFCDQKTNPDPVAIEQAFRLIVTNNVPAAELEEVLLGLTVHPYRPLRERAALSLAQSENGINKLIGLLESTSAWIRSTAVQVLGRMKTARAVRPLVHILETSNDLWLRRDVLLALGEIGDEQVFNLLMRSLQLKEPELICAAARALQALGDPAAIQYLLPLLEDTSAEVVRTAEDVLYSFGSKASTALHKVLADTRSSEKMKAKILRLIKDIPDQMTAPLLLQLLTERGTLTSELIRTMSAWKYPEFIPALDVLRQEPHGKWRREAELALREIKTALGRA